MARAICIWLPGLAAFVLSACGSSESPFFNDLPRSGAGGTGHAGAAAQAGSVSSSGGSSNPGSAGSTTAAGSAGSPGELGGAGEEETGAGSGGATGGSAAATGGTSAAGGAGAHSGGTSGGRGGAGGGGATGGRAGAPSAGAGGSNQELSCSELLKLANQQLEAARACNLAANSLQCTGTVMNTCNCEVSVQRAESPETKAYLATLKQLKAKDCTTVCTAIACRQINDGECKSSGSGSMGMCTGRSFGLLPDAR